MENPTAKQFKYCSQEILKSEAKNHYFSLCITAAGHKTGAAFTHSCSLQKYELI